MDVGALATLVLKRRAWHFLENSRDIREKQKYKIMHQPLLQNDHPERTLRVPPFFFALCWNPTATFRTVSTKKYFPKDYY
ncbi:hypothetical protein ACA910_022641 [Epithemia clementina (nom. ined.)]